MSSTDQSFFDKERDRLTAEIASGFEEMLSSSNVLNRKLEEVLGMTREYETIASLWQTFHELMRGQKVEAEQDRMVGLPGTGSHHVSQPKPQS